MCWWLLVTDLLLFKCHLQDWRIGGRGREGCVCVRVRACACLSCFLRQLLSWGDKRSSDITNVSKINSRLPLCGTVKAWKGDHMLGWGLRCWGQPHISYHWQVSSPSALSVCCCKTIKHLLTYILLTALSTWKHRHGNARAWQIYKGVAWQRSHR